MADGVSDLEQRILRLRVRYDGIPDEQVADKQALESEIRGLQDQLDELKQADQAMGREAKENIDAVTAIVSEPDELTKLHRALEDAKKTRDAISKQRYTQDTADDIRDADNNIRAIEHMINAHDPTTEDLDLLTDSGAAIAGREAADKYRRDEEAAKQAAKAAKSAKRDAYDQAGPAEREVLDDQKNLAGLDNPYLEQQLADARKKDDAMREGIKQGRKAGCTTSPTVLAGIGIGAAVVIAVILVLLNSGDDKSSPVSAGGNAAQSSDASGEKGDIAGFAGHYVFSSGFQDPKSAVGFQVADGAYNSVKVIEADGDFDVDASGKITGGNLHVKEHAEGSQLTCDFAFDASAASGSVALYGDIGAIGQIVWNGKHTTSLCKEGASTYDTSQLYQIGIVGGDVTVCGTNMAPTLKGCQDPYPHVVGTFVKQS